MTRPRHLFCALLLPLFLIACGDDAPEQTDGADVEGGPSRLEVDAPSPGFSEKIPEDDPYLEAAIAKQHKYLMGQVSKRTIDSIMQVNIFTADNFDQGKERAEKELNKLMRRQDTLARYALADQFGMPDDTIDAILQRQGVEWR